MKNSTGMTKANIRMLASIPPEVSSDERVGIVGEVLPEQFYTPAQESHERWTGERGLMLAVLEEAVHSYLKYRNATTRRGRRLFAETQAWFWSDDQEYLFAFENICTYLQLDPNYVRRGLEGTAQLRLPRSNPQAAQLTCRHTTVPGLFSSVCHLPVMNN